MFFQQTQEQTPFHEMSPRERLAFLIYKSDFEPSEFGLALTAIGFGGHMAWVGWHGDNLYWALPMCLLGLAQMTAWWIGRNRIGRWIRVGLSIVLACFWLGLLLVFGGGPVLWLYLLPTYTCFWALYRLGLRIRATAWVEGRG